MEKRRRALGLIKSGITPEKNAVKSSRQISTNGESSKSNSDDKTIARGKAPQKGQPPGSVTPKQKTQISRSNVTPLKPESPCSPLQSPGCQMIFPGTLASPEIEVSWDWSCSQVPKEMLPPKRTKRVQDSKVPPPVLPTINMRPRPRPPLQRQITEEENQQRLEYYKNILSLKPSESSSDVLYDSTNNNVEDESKLCNTPKRPTTRSSSATKKKDEDNSLFDDSANEFMIECSQAIEEKLKNGEIDMGPIVDIKLSQAKRLHSPGIDIANSHKKACHGRVNLFPETLKRGGICSKDKVDSNDQIDSCLIQKPITSNNNTLYSNFALKRTGQSLKECEDNAPLNYVMDSKSSGDKTNPTQNSININKVKEHIFNSSKNKNNSVHTIPFNSNCPNLERRPLSSKPAQPSNNQLSNTHTTSSQNRCTQRLQTRANITNQTTVNNFRKPQSSNNTLCKDLKPQNCITNILRSQQDVKKQENCTISQEKEMHKPKFNYTMQDKSNTSDITTLLDDDFDLELSCLDVDSLCRNSENKNPESKCVTIPAPKLCTQQEIEAKRLAALQKLMMKKKR